MVGYVFYLYTSRRQQSLQEEVENLRQMLGEEDNQFEDRA
jgi:hypothetical protein